MVPGVAYSPFFHVVLDALLIGSTFSCDSAFFAAKHTTDSQYSSNSTSNATSISAVELNAVDESNIK